MDSSKVIPIAESDRLLADYDPKKNVSAPFLTRFEKTALVGVRLQQLYKGAPTVLDDDELKGLDTFEAIVERELKLKKIPLMIVRSLPNNEKELWRLSDLLIF